MKPPRRALLFVLALACPALVLAHPGTAVHAHGGFVDGALHPLTGADHLVAMLAVGAWSALSVRQVWIAPLAFVAMLACGMLAGAAGLVVPGVEPMIAASLVGLGLLIAWLRRVPALAAAALAGSFAFFHGAAHGTELGASIPLLAGLLVATAALHLAGIAAGQLVLARHRWLPQMTGSLVALLGITLLLRLA
ncbi:HupE/UreJ family protein [Ramlibacter sp. MMS24-I3-19]|uniref:HupE/UreJ family protein n=1 Tax=Ramlibacter sp. MMS24-I3-19 TaxID=3416606 RepID=UPI003D055979